MSNILRCSMKINKLYFKKIIKLLILIFIINILFVKYYEVKIKSHSFGGHAIISCNYDESFILPNTNKVKPLYKICCGFKIWIPFCTIGIFLLCYFRNFSYNRRSFIFQFLISNFNGSKYKSGSYLLI